MLTEPDLMIGRDADRTRLDDWSRHIILKRFCNVPLSYMSLRLGLYSTIMKKISFFSLDIIKQALLPGTRQRLAKETRTGSRDAFRNQVRGGYGKYGVGGWGENPMENSETLNNFTHSWLKKIQKFANVPHNFWYFFFFPSFCLISFFLIL